MRKVVIAKRSHPELNPRITSFDFVKKWAHDPSVYISFTKIDKLGMNPQSYYDTPLGIYAYPLSAVWDMYSLQKKGDLKPLYFSAITKYLWVMKVKTGPQFISDLSKYTNERFARDVKILKQDYFFHKGKKLGVDLSDINDPAVDQNKLAVITDKWQTLRMHAKHGKHHSYPGSEWFMLMKLCCYDITGASLTTGDIKAITLWNKFLRNCGYTGISDLGGRVIHPNEPIQTVFLTKDAFTVLGETINTEYMTPQQLMEEYKKSKISGVHDV